MGLSSVPSLMTSDRSGGVLASPSVACPWVADAPSLPALFTTTLDQAMPLQRETKCQQSLSQQIEAHRETLAQSGSSKTEQARAEQRNRANCPFRAGVMCALLSPLTFNASFLEKLLSQKLQGYGFTAKWILLCRLRS